MTFDVFEGVLSLFRAWNLTQIPFFDKCQSPEFSVPSFTIWWWWPKDLSPLTFEFSSIKLAS